MFKSNIIVAIWDGSEAGSQGGTWEAIRLCRKLKKQFIHIDTSNKTMHLYFAQGFPSSRAIALKHGTLTEHL